jgi:hypothetical protein
MFKKPIIIFFLGVILIATPLFLFPINLFNGAIVFENGPQKIVQDAPLSLSYFIGLGYKQEEMKNVTDFYLTREGYVLAFCLIIGFPALLAYRLKIKFDEAEKKKLK